MSDLPFTVETFDDRAEWLEARGIGGSDAATIAGLNDYESPLDLWSVMAGRDEPFTGNLATRSGRALEGVIAEEFTRKSGIPVHDPGLVLVRSVERPWQTATPDRLILSDPSLETPCEHWQNVASSLEIKWTLLADDWHDLEPDMKAQAQVQHFLSITGLEGGHIAVLIGNKHFKRYEVERHESFISGLLEAEDAFRRCVEADVPPEGEWVPGSFKGLLGHLRGGEVTLPVEAQELVQELEEAAELEKAAKARKEGAKSCLKTMALREAGFAQAEEPPQPFRILIPGLDGAYVWKLTERKGYPVKPTTVEFFRRVKR
jgi:putative phage-type endonuclease